MAVWTLGLNHRTAPLDLRSRFAFVPEQIETALHELRQQQTQQGWPLAEAAIISTCNRTEIYCAGEPSAIHSTLHWLAQKGRVPTSTLHDHTYTWQADESARHAFRVASGLDSMVLGEPQILGQMKTAVRTAQNAGSLGRTLNQLFQRSFAIAKEVRSSTAIGSHSISMAAAVVKLAAQHLGDLRQARILFVGAGEMIALACTHFAAQSPRQITIANRRSERSAALAARVNGHSMMLAELPQRLHEFDVVVSCTASTLPLIGLGAVERAVHTRHQSGQGPMLLVDMAVPRDIEPEVKDLPGIHLYTVDDLAALVQTGQASRQAAVAQAEAIIDNGVQRFMHWLQQRDPSSGLVPLICQVRQQAEHWRAQELARARKQLARGESAEAVLESLSRRLNNKMLHGALRELHHPEADSQLPTADLMQRLFLHNRP
ncbi:MAG: glutamyl-tRNA reductase [Brachymonas sp.]|nr:glutamyl-tRNA reductase [Brachymonas sp.]